MHQGIATELGLVKANPNSAITLIQQTLTLTATGAMLQLELATEATAGLLSERSLGWWVGRKTEAREERAKSGAARVSGLLRREHE